MKLDRNLEGNEGHGKYALLLLRQLATYDDGKVFGGIDPKIADAIKTLEDAGIIDWGREGTEREFMVIRLKDKYAHEALVAYAVEAEKDDKEYADEIYYMASRAGSCSRFCKKPD